MSAELVVVNVNDGYVIEVKNGEINREKYGKFLKHVYKHKHIAVARKKLIEAAID